MLIHIAGCVLPVAPEFQNPPLAPNYYPYLSNSDPPIESTVTVTNAGRMFYVAIGDQNQGDTLYLRWVSDYPPYNSSLSKILRDGPENMGLPIAPSTPQAELRPDITLDARCDAFTPGMQQHRLVVIVSDRPFLKTMTYGGGLQYGAVANRPGEQTPVTYPVMAGWNVVCP